MFGLTTIRRGQRVAVWSRRGEVRFVDGPRMFPTLGRTIQSLRRYCAAPGEFLVVRFQDGRIEHLRGPASLWFNPVEHASIDVKPCLIVDSHEAIVVYRRDESTVARRVEHGPALFMPTAEEWLHEFRWHGADPKRPDQKIPRALQFTKLRVIPDQMYFDVADVRTSDDALLTIRLMVFFELKNIELMLDQTHDPIADFINALSADVIDFAASLSFEEFKERTEALNELATYGQIVQRAERIGYAINKVVYRGYHASDRLQEMHDHAIEARTQLHLEAETQRQAQELADMKLRCEAERAIEQRAMEQANVEHQNRLAQMKHDETMRQRGVELEAELDAQRRHTELTVEERRAANAEQVTLWQQMRAMQVDLTRYLVAQYQNPDRLIRIAGEPGNAQLHLHDN
jgi:hypothetical protein